jgi:hypothetical protein
MTLHVGGIFDLIFSGKKSKTMLIVVEKVQRDKELVSKIDNIK